MKKNAELDRFVKHTLRARHYVRYMDDFVIIHHDKPQLHKWRADIERFLHASLRLSTNSKTQVFPISPAGGRALDFLGYRIYATHRLLRSCSVKRIKDKLKTYRRQFAEGEIGVAGVQQKIQSWLGHAGHANTYHLRQQLLAQPFTRREGMDDANTDIHL